MPFVNTVPPSDADGAVREMYDRVKAEQGTIPNWAHVFSLRPAVRAGWVALITSIRPNLSTRRYELVTLAAAKALRSTYCSLAHGRVLASQVFDAATMREIASGDAGAVLEPAEIAMMEFARKVVLGADRITESDVAALRSHGLGDDEIFDIAAAAAARCFFSKLLDALGVQADSGFQSMDTELRDALTVGRPVATVSS
jgi:uncharacterized peroxidase-related enzyme